MSAGAFVPDPLWMRRAIADVLGALPRSEGGPFGACLVRGNDFVVVAHNTVLRDNDATCHAEVNAIRAASKLLATFDLSGCIIYSTTEPCPMCFSAIHWARIDRIVYGTRIADVQRLGFNELMISSEELGRVGGSSVSIYKDFLRAECELLLKQWQVLSGRVY